MSRFLAASLPCLYHWQACILMSNPILAPDQSANLPIPVSRSPERAMHLNCETSTAPTRSSSDVVSVCHGNQLSVVASHANPLPAGIPNVYYFGQEGLHNILVIDLLGPSLEDLFDHCGRRFTIKTVVMVAKQMVSFRRSSASEPQFLTPPTAFKSPDDPREEPDLQRYQARQLFDRQTWNQGFQCHPRGRFRHGKAVQRPQVQAAHPLPRAEIALGNCSLHEYQHASWSGAIAT